MRLLIHLLPVCLACICSANLTAQYNTPSTARLPGAQASIAALPPPMQPRVKVNFIRTKEAKQPFTDIAVLEAQNYTKVQQTTQYFDGIGRPIQKVIQQLSSGNNPRDMVAPNLYDDYGREAYHYLPYPQATGNYTNDGSFKLDPFASQQSYYNTYTTNQNHGLDNEQVFYGKTIYESSPLNRPVKTFAPGNSWAGSDGSTDEHAISLEYLINTAGDDVKTWTIGYDPIPGNNIPATTAAYPAGELYKTVTKDELGKAVVEYKDKEGEVILKKVQIAGGLSAPYEGYSGWLCTYYVYDDYKRLRFVIPPKATATFLVSGFSLSPAVADELCFRYEYDRRNRMAAKKVPGAAWVHMLYDKRDRLVCMQDGNLRTNNQWMVTLYDEINRPVQTGLMDYNGIDLQDLLDGANYNSPSSMTTTGTNTSRILPVLDVPVRDAGRQQYQASAEINFDDGFESENNAEFTGEIVPATLTNFTTTQTTTGFTIPAAATYIPLTITNYDDYSYTTKRYNTAYNSLTDGQNLANDYKDPLPAAHNDAVRGMLTGTKVRVLTSTSLADLANAPWLESTPYYDDKGRIVQVQARNYKGGEDVATTRYNFTGQPVSVYTIHNNSSGNISDLAALTEMHYDHAGRLIDIWKTIKGEASKTRLIGHNDYDELGQLMHKNIGQKTDEITGLPLTGTKLEGQDYAYNIRGWLKGINWDYAPNTGPTLPHTDYQSDRWFGMDLSYDWGYDHNQYNGNIAGIRWESAGDGEERSYGYGYDNANRLLYADFKQNFGSGSTANWNNNDPAGNFNIDFSVKMGNGINHASAYDENGNILGMTQKGLKLNTSPDIDILTYNYNANTNKLQNVIDGNNDMQTKLGDFRSSQTYMTALGNTKTIAAIDYTYDDNGNLKKDRNKDIGTASTDGIQYNHLNLPYQIAVAGKGTIKYIYDATGNKLEKITDEPASAANNNTPKNTATTYLGGYVYENNVLQFFGQEEGRIRKKGIDYVYDYFVKDHLGNVRMVLTDEHDKVAYPAATMESTPAPAEEALYSNLQQTRIPLPPGYPVDNTTNPNANVAMVSGAQGDHKIGPSIILKVMAGDKFNIKVSSWYKTNNIPPDQPVSPLPDLILALANELSGAASSAAHGSIITPADVQNTGLITPNAQQFLNSQTPVFTRPKAYLNWILFDEHFKYVGSSSGAEQVPDENTFGTVPNQVVYPHVKVDMPIDKNGYLYVYVSNETPNIPVFFDNLQVTHIKGPLAEETHYYPFGLTMSGISSEAAKGTDYAENKKGFNGNELQSKEFSDLSGLAWYDFNARTYDPQTGRFIQIDPLPTDGGQEAISPYHFANNNPIKINDPDGKCGICIPIIEGIIEEGIALWRVYRTAKTVQSATNLMSQKEVSSTVTIPMVITSDARGNTVAIPEAQLPAFQNQVKSEQIDNVKGELKNLNSQLKGQQKALQQHEKKLNDYENNPEQNDNKNKLKDGGEHKEDIKSGREEFLKKTINNVQNQIQKVQEQIKTKQQELKQLTDKK